MLRTITFLALLITLQFIPNYLSAQEDSYYEEISEGLFLIKNISGGNTVFLVTRKGVIVVDAGSSPSNGEKIVSIISSVTNKPIKYLILTHFHGDHINGISSFPQDINIIAHENLEDNNNLYNREKLNNQIDNILPADLIDLKFQLGEIKDKNSSAYLELKKQYDGKEDYLENLKNIEFRKPDITFKDFYGLKLADERIMLEYTESGHTNDNIVVKFSNHNVIHTGDLVFNGYVPYLIEEHGVDVHNWITSLDELYEENIYTVIPGHGVEGEKSLIKEQSDHFKLLSRKIEVLKSNGLNLDDITKKISIHDFGLTGSENQFKKNIEVIYKQLTDKGIEWWEF